VNKINSNELEETVRSSPKGKFGGTRRTISLALGRDPTSTDLLKRHPFDVEIQRVSPGRSFCPYHAHSSQFEFYWVISGRGEARDATGQTAIEPGDAFLFKPGEAHQMTNTGSEDLVFYVIADNPFGESCHYPDSGKWLVTSPERTVIRSEPLDYFDGEE
jgi:uncharacterized cupin superfamily protein